MSNQNQYFIYRRGERGKVLKRIEYDPAGKFIPPITAYSEAQAIAFYIKRILNFVGSEEATRQELRKYRAIPTTSDVDKHVPLTTRVELTSEQRQQELFPEEFNAQYL